MSVTDPAHFDELVSRYLDDTLTDAEAAGLAQLLAEPPVAARFLEMTRLNSEIAGLLAAPVPDQAMAELVRADIEKCQTVGQPPSVPPLRLAEGTHRRATFEPCVLRPGRKLYPWRLVWAALFLVSGAAIIWFGKRSEPPGAPSMTALHGEVYLAGAEGQRILKAGDSWQRGETLQTVGPNSAAAVTFADGTRLDFGGNTVAVNQSSTEGHRVELEHGTVQGAVKKQPARRSFTFASSETEAIVVGTTLRLVTGAHLTRLDVTEGEVRFRRRLDRAEVAVKAGQFAIVAPNVPFLAKPISADPHHIQ